MEKIPGIVPPVMTQIYFVLIICKNKINTYTI